MAYSTAECGIGLLLRLRLNLMGAAALTTLFIVQVALAIIWQGNEPRIGIANASTLVSHEIR